MYPEKICLASKTIDIAENDLYLELTNRMCYYDDKNLNNVLLPYKDIEEKALECAKSLIDMPVQAAYKKIEGQDDLGSHEMHVLPDGEVVFDTESIGTHVDVWIEEEEVTTVSGEVKILPCLYAKKRIWKRNKNFINAIKRLYESDSGLGSSWEVQVLEYTFKDGVKILTNYVFLSDCLLGSTTVPAYNGTSKAISLSTLSKQDLMIAEALSLDLGEQTSNTNNKTKEDNTLNNINTNEVSALTSYDLRKKLWEACQKKIDGYCWVSYIFPEDHEVWCEYDGETALDYLKFTYTVENDVVTVSEPEKVTLTVSVKDINKTVTEYENVIAEKDELIIKVSSEITSLKNQNAEMAQYKEKFTQMEQSRIESELKQQKEELIASVVASGQITKEEIESSEELTGYVNDLDKKSLMAIIGERLLSSVENTNNKDHEVNDAIHIASNLSGEDDESFDKTSIMRKYLRN